MKKSILFMKVSITMLLLILSSCTREEEDYNLFELPRVKEVVITNHYNSLPLFLKHEYYYNNDGKVDLIVIDSIFKIYINYQGDFTEINFNQMRWRKDNESADIFYIYQNNPEEYISYNYAYDSLNMISCYRSNFYVMNMHHDEFKTLTRLYEYLAVPDACSIEDDFEIDYQEDGFDLPDLDLYYLLPSDLGRGLLYNTYLFSFRIFCGLTVKKQIETVYASNDGGCYLWDTLHDGWAYCKNSPLIYNYFYEFNDKNLPVKISIHDSDDKLIRDLEISYY